MASTKVGIASFSRFPHIRSAASQRIVSASRLPRRRAVTAAVRSPRSLPLVPSVPGSRASGETRYLNELVKNLLLLGSCPRRDTAPPSPGSVLVWLPYSVASSSCRPSIRNRTGNIFMRQQLRAGNKSRESMRPWRQGGRWRPKCSSVWGNCSPGYKRPVGMQASHCYEGRRVADLAGKRVAVIGAGKGPQSS